MNIISQLLTDETVRNTESLEQELARQASDVMAPWNDL